MSQKEHEPEDIDYVLGEAPALGEQMLVSLNTEIPGIPAGENLDEEAHNFKWKQPKRYLALRRHARRTGRDIVMIPQGNRSTIIVGIGATVAVGASMKVAIVLYKHRHKNKR